MIKKILIFTILVTLTLIIYETFLIINSEYNKEEAFKNNCILNTDILLHNSSIQYSIIREGKEIKIEDACNIKKN